MGDFVEKFNNLGYYFDVFTEGDFKYPRETMI